MNPTDAFELPQWQLGLPPHEELCFLACRKWSGMHEGKYIEVVAGDPAPYFEVLGITPAVQPGVTGIFGSVVRRGGVPYILGEHGQPAGFYPDSVLAWCPPVRALGDLEAAASARMLVAQARKKGG